MLKAMADKVLVVGAGMTGAAVACFLRQNLQKSVVIWDKSLGIGGRMSTSRCNKDSRSTVDLGAQYISATPDYSQKHARDYKELVEAGVLHELTGTIHGHQDKVKGTKHYVTPTGCSSLVKHYINKADVNVGKGHLVKDVSIATEKVKVTTDKGVSDLFDAVVLTMPIPQILQLQGDIQSLIDSKGIRSDLESVSYSCRFAVGLFYEPGTTLNCPWSARYFTDNPCIRFISIDNRKRGQDSNEIGPSICVHTGVPWSLSNLERDKDEVAQDILVQLKTILPDLPEPTEIKGHKWRYSQVHEGYPGSPGCVVLKEDPLVIVAGDAFSHSNFDGCLESALSVIKSVENIQISKVKL